MKGRRQILEWADAIISARPRATGTWPRGSSSFGTRPRTAVRFWGRLADKVYAGFV